MAKNVPSQRLTSHDQSDFGHPLGVQYDIAAQWCTVRSEVFVVQAAPENTVYKNFELKPRIAAGVISLGLSALHVTSYQL